MYGISQNGAIGRTAKNRGPDGSYFFGPVAPAGMGPRGLLLFFAGFQADQEEGKLKEGDRGAGQEQLVKTLWKVPVYGRCR